jgi:hypothetical protein
MKPDLKLIDGGNGVSDAKGFVAPVTLAGRLLELGIENALVMDGYDDCVVGVLERFGQKEAIVMYDKEQVIQQLMDEGCDSYEEALEYYSYNQLGGWHGGQTPGFLVWLPEL